MSAPVIIAVPMTVIHCRAWIDYSKGWSIIDEAVLLALALGRGVHTVSAIVISSGLPHQVVVASLARLMRFRLVEISISAGTAGFVASSLGSSLVRGGRPLPHFPHEMLQRFSFGVEHVTGSCFLTRDTRVARPGSLEDDRQQGADVRILPVTEAYANSIPESSIARLYDLIERGGERRLLRLATHETVILRDRFMRLTLSGGAIRHFPEDASPALRQIVQIAGAGLGKDVAPASTPTMPKSRNIQLPVNCDFDPSDIVIGGSAQSTLLLAIINQAMSRLVIHSTFLDSTRFDALIDPLRNAVARGVIIDLLWGTGETATNHARNAAEAEKISAKIRSDAAMRGRVNMHMRTTGSHSKLLLADTEDGNWTAVVSSCNWLSTRFGPAELSVVLRHPLAVAQVVELVQGMVGRRPLADALAEELRIRAIHLKRSVGHTLGGAAVVTLVVGQAHDAAMREASGQVTRRLVIGSNRLGSTAWTGALIPGELAAEREGVSVTVLYDRPSGPVRNRHAKAVEQEAASLGIRLLQTNKVPLHGKFVIWDDDDVIVTSLNWASSSTDDEFPASEIGVHVRCPGLAARVMEQLEAIFPELLPASPLLSATLA